MFNSYLDREDIKNLKAMAKKADFKPLEGSNGRAYTFRDINGALVLLSYWTVVCKITKDGKLIKLWDNWSATTMRHINKFCELDGHWTFNKKGWLDYPYGEGGAA